MANDLNARIATENAVRANADSALAARVASIQATLANGRATINPPAPTKPTTIGKVVGAVKSVLGNPLVQSALSAFLLKKLTKK